VIFPLQPDSGKKTQMKRHLIPMLLALACGMTDAAGNRSNPATASAAVGPMYGLPDFSELVRRQGPSVVNVRVYRSKSGDAGATVPDSRKDLIQPPGESSLGSGFVVSSDGVILTNRHVVLNADKIRVRFADKRDLPAVIVGMDALTDLAVLKVDAKNLPTAMQGDSSKLRVGQWVLAIGAPMGLERTATQGIISALGRALPTDNYVSFIQTDVPINPGNSGGPLFDLEGRVVGINSQIVSTSGGYMGLSFAIPINVAVTVARQIVQQGHATHGWLGATAQELTVELAEAYGLDSPRGALITELAPAGPAEKAGLQFGDIVVAFDDAAIAESADLPPMIGASQPGTDHVLVALRDGQVIRLHVTMGDLEKANTTKKHFAPVVKIERLGLKVSDVDSATQQVFALHGGVLVDATEDGPAATAGIQAGDILLKLGRFPLTSAEHLQSLLATLPVAQPLPLLVKRDDNVSFITITLPPLK